MKIRDINIERLTPYKNNPRNNQEAIDKVAESINEFGFKVPLVIDKDEVIVAGHVRYEASKKLGLKKVPCIIADDLTAEQIKAFRLVDNKVAENSSWNDELLHQELLELKVLDFNIELFGFDTNEIDVESISEVDKNNLIDQINKDNQVKDDGFDIEIREDKVAITRPGYIWQLGNHRLMCGDSTESSSVDKLMGDIRADLCVTDPPYNIALGMSEDTHEARKRHRRQDGQVIMNDNMSDDEFLSFLTKSFKQINRVLKDGASFYIWHSDSESLNFRLALRNAKLILRQNLIWNKNTMTLGRQDYQWKHEPCLYGWKEGATHSWYNDRSQTTVLDYNKPNKSELHPTMKPIELISYQINNSSKKKDIVFEPFGGSGTTLIACEQMNRICYCKELDPIYCDVIVDRWQSLTGSKAVLLNG